METAACERLLLRWIATHRDVTRDDRGAPFAGAGDPLNVWCPALHLVDEKTCIATRVSYPIGHVRPGVLVDDEDDLRCTTPQVDVARSLRCSLLLW